MGVINLKVIDRLPKAFQYSVRTYLLDALPGEGKTQVLTAIGFHEYLFNHRKIASTYPVKYPHKLVKTQDDVLKLRNYILLGDELWRTFFSRSGMRKDQQELLGEFTENIRKRNITMYCTTHRIGNIDVMLREGIFTHRIIPRKIMLVTPDENTLSEYETETYSAKTLYDTARAMLNTPENTGILLEVYDRYGYFYSSWVIKNLSEFGNLFKTWEEVGRITKKPGIMTPQEAMKIGMKIEKYGCNALERCDFIEYVELLPNSGRDSSWKADAIAYGKKKVGKKIFGIDFKSSNKSRVTVTQYNGNGTRKMPNWNDKIANIERHCAIPLIMFPMNDKKQLNNPKFWYVHKLHYKTYLKTIKNDPTYNEFIKHSVPLLKFPETNDFC